MGMAFKNGPIVQVMKENGVTTRLTDTENSGMWMGTFLRAIERTIRLMGRGFTLILTELVMMGNGKMTFRTDLVSKLGLIIASIWAFTGLVKSMDLVPIIGQMGQCM